MRVEAPVVAGREVDRTLRFLARVTSFQSSQTDPEVIAPGDALFIGGAMLEFDGANDQVGTFGYHCAATGADGSELLCAGGYILPAGKITIQMLIVQPDEPLRFAAITGGTGAYRRARGEATGVTRPNGDEEVTFIFDGG